MTSYQSVAYNRPDPVIHNRINNNKLFNTKERVGVTLTPLIFVTNSFMI